MKHHNDDQIILSKTLQELQDLKIYHTFYDAVTKLPNRKLFEKKIIELIEVVSIEQRKFVIFYLDVNRFKYLNDILGHETGDLLLEMVGKRLSANFGNGEFVARMAGDQFTILLDHANSIQLVQEKIKEIIDLFLEPFIIENYEVRVTVSIGISMYPNDGEDALTLVKNAHIALTRAKEKGNSSYQFFTSSMDTYSHKIFTLENDLYKAYEKKEFILHYQPRVDIRSGNILGAEALIRWKHPVWNMINPDEFIPLAEEIGLIIPISNWALKTVCQQNKEWQDKGLPKIQISVNLSTKHFLQKDLVETIRSILDETGLEAKYLEIEITENILIENSQMVLDVLNRLREMGVKIALDDFGTGYCSLSYLKNFAMDIVKIDKSFMKNLPHNPVDAAIVTSVINLAKILQKKVVAEGVETEEQLTFLYEKHCDEIQGFFFSKPVDTEIFSKMLEQGECIIDINKNLQQDNSGNRRKYLRIQLDTPLSSDMSIKEFRGKEIDLGRSEILIEDLGPGGLRFASNIQLPIDPDIIFKIETVIMGQTLQLLGNIIWSKKLSNSVFEYGLQFLLTEPQRTMLIESLDKLGANRNRQVLMPNTKFVTENVFDYLGNKDE